MTKKADRPPTSQERKACWQARDAYFECLDENGLWLQGLAPETYDDIVKVDPLRLQFQPDTRSHSKLYTCRKFKELFDNQCLASWVHSSIWIENWTVSWHILKKIPRISQKRTLQVSHFSMLRVKDIQTVKLKEKIQKDEKERQTKDDAFWNKVVPPSKDEWDDEYKPLQMKFVWQPCSYSITQMNVFVFLLLNRRANCGWLPRWWLSMQLSRMYLHYWPKPVLFHLWANILNWWLFAESNF